MACVCVRECVVEGVGFAYARSSCCLHKCFALFNVGFSNMDLIRAELLSHSLGKPEMNQLSDAEEHPRKPPCSPHTAAQQHFKNNPRGGSGR